MKPVHYFIILLFISLFQHPAFSQSPSTIGITAGMNLPYVEFESVDNESKEQYIGYYGGLRAQVPIKGNFSLVSNLIYSLKGWQFEYATPSLPADVYLLGTMHLHYLDLQVSGQYAITKSLAVNAGVEVGRLLKTRRDPYIDLFDDLYQKGDFSLLMGLNYKIWKSIRLEARYLHGLSYLIKANVTDINGNDIGVVKGGNFGVFQFGISADLITLKGAEKQKV